MEESGSGSRRIQCNRVYIGRERLVGERECRRRRVNRHIIGINCLAKEVEEISLTGEKSLQLANTDANQLTD